MTHTHNTTGAKTGRARLDVEEWGSGTPCLMVHGALTTGPENWEGQRPLADEGYRLVVPNRRGYGDSPDDGGEDFLRDGDDVLDLLDLLGEESHLVGHSYGAMAALVAAERRPEAVLSLALIEPPAFGVCADHPAAASLVAKGRALFADTRPTDREFLEKFLRLVGESPEEVPEDMLDAWTHRVPVVRYARTPWETDLPLERLGASSVPTLVISGDHHPAFNAVCETLTRRLRARSTIIRGAGHEIQLMAEPCNRVLLELWNSAQRA